MGEISDTFGREPHPVTIRHGGVVIGVRINPLVYKGEALIHLAEPVEEDGGEVGAG